MIYCDPETGTCSIQQAESDRAANELDRMTDTLFYFGDPLCSWCWGIAPEVDRLLEHFQPEINFKLVMGGLRPGGGDPWNEQMKQYLRSHWEQVQQKSGQPFSFDLLERDDFTYDTEPPCRAVKTAQSFDNRDGLAFYHEVQHGFYVENGDPGAVDFYKPICEEMEIPFKRFAERFESDEYRGRTHSDFLFSQQSGVRAFPTLAYHDDSEMHLVAYGYTTFGQMKEKLDNIVVSSE